jgi:hypothetical protein
MKTEATTTTTETAAVAEQGANVASKKGASKAKGAPKAKKTAKDAKKAKPVASKQAAKTAKPASKKAPKDAKPARDGSKKAIVIEMLKRKNGATLAEIAKATDWQNHSIRGFISGALGKKMGLTVESTRNDAGERTYRLTS